MKSLLLCAGLCLVSVSSYAVPPGHLEGFVKRLQSVKDLGAGSLEGQAAWKSSHAPADYDNYLILLGTLEGIVRTMTELHTPASNYAAPPERTYGTAVANHTLNYIKAHPSEAAAAPTLNRIVIDALTEAYSKK